MRGRLRSTTKTAPIYVRVSSARQAAEGVSLEAQEARGRAWAQANGFTVAGVHVDAGLSGGRADNRPALQEALTAACLDGSAIVVYSLSRLARSVSDTLSISGRLERAGADLVSLSENIDTTSAAGKMLFRMLAVLAEFERDLASERTEAVLSHLRASGQRVSRHAPLGFAHEAGRVVPDEAEARTVAYVRALRAERLSYRAIVARLNEERVPCRGRRWHLSTVHAVLSSVAA